MASGSALAVPEACSFNPAEKFKGDFLRRSLVMAVPRKFSSGAGHRFAKDLSWFSKMFFNPTATPYTLPAVPGYREP